MALKDLINTTYVIRLTCYDPIDGNPDKYAVYEDVPSVDTHYATINEAFDAMQDMAEKELESLAEAKSKLKTFGMWINEKKDKPTTELTVECYILENEYDDEGETYPVTEYHIETVREYPNSIVVTKDNYNEVDTALDNMTRYYDINNDCYSMSEAQLVVFVWNTVNKIKNALSEKKHNVDNPDYTPYEITDKDFIKLLFNMLIEIQ